MKKRKKKTVWGIIYDVITLKWLMVGLVLFYRKCISPLTPPTCIYYPSCSAYMLEAIEKFGAIKGVIMGIKRLLRCVPWEKGGFKSQKKCHEDFLEKSG